MTGERFHPVDTHYPDDLSLLLYQQNGVISVPQAQQHLSRSTIRHRVYAGTWQLVHRAVIVAHNGPITQEQFRWVASLAAGAGTPALLGGRTALDVLGLQGFPSQLVHVLLPADRREGDPPSGVVVHRTSRLEPEDVAVDRRPPCTTAARSLVDAASWAGTDHEAVTVIALAFHQRLVTLNGVHAALQRLPRARRRRLTWVASVGAAARTPLAPPGPDIPEGRVQPHP